MEVGLTYSSTLDLDADKLSDFTTMALDSAKTRQRALLDLHIHTFNC